MINKAITVKIAIARIDLAKLIALNSSDNKLSDVIDASNLRKNENEGISRKMYPVEKMQKAWNKCIQGKSAIEETVNENRNSLKIEAMNARGEMIKK